MSKGTIYSISISPERGQLKTEVPKVKMTAGYGIEGDGHSGDWRRQITCLDWASLVKSNKEHGLDMGPGNFAENVLIAGMNFSDFTVGSKLKLGNGVILEVTQIGKENHPSIVSKTFGLSLLPSEGLFCIAITGGVIIKGDSVEKII